MRRWTITCTAGLWLCLVACEESTSGSDQVALVTESDAGAAADAAGSDAGSVAPPARDAGGQPDGATPELPACTKCAVDKCKESLTSCGQACAVAAACIASCTTATCQDDCARDAAIPEAAPFKACLVTSCSNECPAARLMSQGISSYAQVDCAKFASCFPRLFLYRFKDLAECQTRATAELARQALLPGTGHSGVGLIDCALATSQLSCDDYMSARARWACAVRGTRANGQPCSDDAQCESGLCPSADLSCATCAATPAPGGTCAAGDRCGFGMICTAAKTCVYPVREGDACDAARPCEDPFYCSGGFCEAAPTAPGELCGTTYGIPDCDYRRGLYCSNATAGTCLEYFAAGPGKTCGVATGGQLVCVRDAPCTGSVCGNPPTVGQTCNSTQGFCAYPEQCVNARCVAPPAASACK